MHIYSFCYTDRCVELSRARTEVANVRSRTRIQLSTMRQLLLGLARCLEFTDSAAQRTRHAIEERFAEIIEAVEQTKKELLDSVESFRTRGTEFNRSRETKVKEEIVRLEDALRLHDELLIDDDCAKVAEYMTNIKLANKENNESEFVDNFTVDYIDIRFEPVSFQMDRRGTESLLDTTKIPFGHVLVVQLSLSLENNSSCMLSAVEHNNDDDDVTGNNYNSSSTINNWQMSFPSTTCVRSAIIGTTPSHRMKTKHRLSSFVWSNASSTNIENKRTLRETWHCRPERISVVHGNQARIQDQKKKDRQTLEYSEVPCKTQFKGRSASGTVDNPVRNQRGRTCLNSAHETRTDVRAESNSELVADKSSHSEASSDKNMINELWSEEVLGQRGLVIYRLAPIDGQSDTELFTDLCLKNFGFAPRIEISQTRRLKSPRHTEPLIVDGVARPSPLLVVFGTIQDADEVVRSYRRFKFKGQLGGHISRYHTQG